MVLNDSFVARRGEFVKIAHLERREEEQTFVLGRITAISRSNILYNSEMGEGLNTIELLPGAQITGETCLLYTSEKIKLDNNDLPVWFRLRHIQLFHEFITEIQDQVSKKIEERIEEIKKSSNYKGYDMPISPVTNALKRYNTEITYAKDNKKTTELPTMVSKPETLAFKLFEADYRQALDLSLIHICPAANGFRSC